MEEASQSRGKQHRAYSRRRFVRTIAAGAGAISVLPLLNACGDSTPTTAPSPTTASTATTAAATTASAATTAAATTTTLPTTSGATTTAAATTAPIATTVISTTTAPAVISGTATITIMGLTGDFSADKIKPFLDANPNIKVNLIDNDATRFKAMLAAGTPPDIFRTSGKDIPNLVLRGVVLDLTKYFNGSSTLNPSDLAKASVINYTVNGAIYGVALNWSPDFSLFVNNQALADAGVAVPSTTQPLTYPELGALATKLTKKEGDRVLRMGYGFEPGWIARHVQQMLASQDQHLYKPDFSAIILKDNPQAVAAVKFFYDLAKSNSTWNPLNPDPSWPGDDVMKDQGSIVQYGYWFGGYASTLKDSPVFNKITMLPAPIWPGGKRVNSCIGGTGFAIAKATKNPDAVWKLYEYYMGGDPSLSYIKIGAGVPSKLSWNQYLPKQTSFQQQIFASLQEELKYSDNQLEINPYYDDTVFTTSYTTNLEKALNNTITFEQLIANLDKDVNTAITEGKAAAG